MQKNDIVDIIEQYFRCNAQLVIFVHSFTVKNV